MSASVRYVVGSAVTLLLTVSPSVAQTDYQLIDAVKSQDEATVRLLINQQSDINAVQPDGATALHWASYVNDLELAKLLVDAGASLDAANDYGVTPLALACDNGSAQMVTYLVAAGASVKLTRSTGETPLMTCARTGALKAVQVLLDHGADPNVAEEWHGQTALMWAAAERHIDVVRMLLENNADVHAVSEAGSTVLLIAARENEPEIVSLLVEFGANVNDMAPDGVTPLIVATVRGHAALAMRLLEYGADPNTIATGYTALHWASGSWHTELTGNLRGIATERDAEWQSMNGVRSGKLDLVRSLLQHGADPDARLAREPPQYGYASPRFRVSLLGATPFTLAAMDGNVSVMRALVEADADTTLGTDGNTTPLMLAAGLGRVLAETRVTEDISIDAVRYVLELGADVNAVNEVGRTPLHGAAHVRSDTVVQLLVDYGAAVNAADERGVTPLMIAEGGGHIFLPGLGGGSTADLLRELGSDRTAPSSFIENFTEGQTRRRR